MQRTLEPEVMDTAEEADGYDAMDHSGPNAALVDRLVELGATGRMLDIGTGPGHIPLLVAERLPEAHVIGIDLAEHMLAHAERHLAEHKRAGAAHAQRVEYQKADAKRIDFPDASFDAVFSNTILHHIPDPRPFLAEAARVLKPGGVLLIRDLYRPETPERALELVNEHAPDESEYNRELFRASLHAALTVEELRAVALEAGVADAEVVVDSDRHMSLQRKAK